MRNRRLEAGLTLAAVALGVALRLRYYLSNPSLWLDEAALALNVLDHAYVALLRPLDANQGAPAAWLWAVKALGQLLGNGEPALRLLPLLASLASLPLLAWLAWRWLAAWPGAPPVAVLLLAVNERAIYYAAEFKPYSSDLLVALLALALLPALAARDAGAHTPRRVVAAGLAAAALVWLAFPAVFVLAAVALALPLAAGGTPAALSRRAALWCALWLAAFALLYLIQLRPLTANATLAGFWADGYPPAGAPPAALAAWLTARAVGLFAFPGGLPPLAARIAALLALGGAVALARRRPAHALALLLPLLLTLAAAVLRRYPFADRMTLFLLPSIWLLVAVGLAALAAALAAPLASARRWPAAVLLTAATLALAWQPLTVAVANWQQPNPKQALRPLLAELPTLAQADDRLYIYAGARPAFGYYRARLGLTAWPVTLGNSWRAEPARYAQEVVPLAQAGGRVWFVFSHVYTNAAGDSEQTLLLAAAERLGGRIVTQRSGAHAALVLVAFD